MPRTSSKPSASSLVAFVVTFLVAALGFAVTAPEAFAKKRRAGKSKPAASASANPSVRNADDAAAVQTAETADTKENSASRTRAATTTDPAAPRPATAAGKPRVYTFGGLDVNGNLKAPQLLFFRGRVKQELDTSSPEKRSFLKELEKTADAKGL
jgi:hypothetical protein